MVGVTLLRFSLLLPFFRRSSHPRTHTFLGRRGGAQPRQPSLNPLQPSLPTTHSADTLQPPPNYEDQYTRKLARAAPTLLACRPPSSTDSLDKLDLPQPDGCSTAHSTIRSKVASTTVRSFCVFASPLFAIDFSNLHSLIFAFFFFFFNMFFLIYFFFFFSFLIFENYLLKHFKDELKLF